MKSTILAAVLLFFLSPDLLASQGTNVCLLPKKTGFCRARFPRFYFNGASGRCVEFVYGGCGGNGNNFKTMEECKKTCMSVCDLPKERGFCRGHFPRYYFDATCGQCKTFIYGGCGGNSNNFHTLKECKRKCGAK